MNKLTWFQNIDYLHLAHRSVALPLNAILDPPQKFYMLNLINRIYNNILFDKPACPYKKVWVETSEIEYKINHKEDNMPLRSRQGGIGQIKGGDWDLPKYRTNVRDNYIIKSIRKRYIDDVEWEDTIYYKHLYKKYEGTSKHNVDNYESVDEFLKERFNNYDDLYNEILNQGYQADHQGDHKGPNHTQPVRDGLEILVTIDRCGNINFYEGHHRFAMADVLDLKIPVNVLCRHIEWQQFRDNIFNSGLKEYNCAIRKHPDLQDII